MFHLYHQMRYPTWLHHSCNLFYTPAESEKAHNKTPGLQRVVSAIATELHDPGLLHGVPDQTMSRAVRGVEGDNHGDVKGMYSLP